MPREYRITIERLNENRTETATAILNDGTPRQIYSRIVEIDNEGQAIRSIDDALSRPVPVKRKRRKDAGKPRSSAELPLG